MGTIDKNIESKAENEMKIGQLLIPDDEYEFEMMMPFEMCRCGHIRQDHDDTVAIGHGKCLYGKFHGICSCIKFTWNGKYGIEK